MRLSLSETKKNRRITAVGKILVVDDDVLWGYLLREMLQAEGYRVRIANNARSGVFCFLQFQPQLVITDISMPGANGLEMMKLIRGYNPRVRTIYMSGDLNTFQSQIEEERRLYGTLGISKPFSRREIMKLINEDRIRYRTAAR